jgi:hypothetical protein
MMRYRWLLLIFAALIIISSAFAAAQTDNLLEPILESVDKLQIGENYDRYPYVVNFFIYLIIFAGLTKTLLKGRLGNAAAVGVGVALSISLSWFEYTSGILMRDFMGKVGLTIIVIMVGVFLYLLTKSIAGKNAGTVTTACISYVVVYLFMLSAGHEVMELLRETSSTLVALLSLAFIICLIRLFFSAGSLFKGVGGGSDGDGKGGFLGNLFSPKTPEQKEKERAKREELNEKKTLERIEKDGKRIEEIDRKLLDDLSRMTVVTIESLKKILKAMKDLGAYVIFIQKHYDKDNDKARDVYHNQYHNTLHHIYDYLIKAAALLHNESREIKGLTRETRTLEKYWKELFNSYMIKEKKFKTKKYHFLKALKFIMDKIKRSSKPEAHDYEIEAAELRTRTNESLSIIRKAAARIPRGQTLKDMLQNISKNLQNMENEFRRFIMFFKQYDDSASATSPGTFRMKLVRYDELKRIIVELEKIIRSYENVAPPGPVSYGYSHGAPPSGYSQERENLENLRIVLRHCKELEIIAKKVEDLQERVIKNL